MRDRFTKDQYKLNRLFETSHLMLLIGDSAMTALLIAESLRVGWERWPLILIFAGVVTSWVLHLRRMMTPRSRLWVYAVIICCTFFYYGVHATSRFDMIAIMAGLMMMFTMTGVRHLITLAQLVYYGTFGYNLIRFFLSGGKADPLLISRIVLHTVSLTMVAWVARTIISKWEQVIREAGEEIKELTQATERLDDFLANASHEVRTPVNAVVGLTGVCLDRELSEENRRDIREIRRAGRRVAEQMSDILDYTEIDRDRLRENPENYVLSSLIEDVVERIRPYTKPQVEFIVDVDTSIPSVMTGDVIKIKKIIWHLVVNGLKYTREGGVYLHITSMKEEYGVNLCIDVVDTGVGMNEDEKDRIFDRFYQADSGRSRNNGGLGLGMSVVNGFVLVMGGFITIDTEVGQGTTVHVCIPQRVVDSTPCAVVSEREQVSLGAFFAFNKYAIPKVREFYNDLIRHVVKGMGVPIHGVDSIENLKKMVESDSVQITHLFIGMKEYETDPDYVEEVAAAMPVYITADMGYTLPPGSHVRLLIKPLYCFPIVRALSASFDEENSTKRMRCQDLKVLVVDDEPMNLIVAQGILGGYGMQVDTAGSGREAIDLCSERHYDIVFMDHMMPGMDGVETMKQIRSDVRRKTVPLFVALTANTISTAREMFRREGFDGFVGKPIERMELERVLKNILPADRITYERALEKPEAAASFSAPEPVEPADEPAPVPESAGDGEGGALSELSEKGFDVEAGMSYCQSDESLYLMLLEDFGESARGNIDYLEEKLAGENLKDYEIKIHSVKSTSRLIGAPILGDMAEELENMAREGHLEDVRSHHEEAIRIYGATADAIREVVGR